MERVIACGFISLIRSSVFFSAATRAAYIQAAEIGPLRGRLDKRPGPSLTVK